MSNTARQLCEWHPQRGRSTSRDRQSHCKWSRESRHMPHFGTPPARGQTLVFLPVNTTTNGAAARRKKSSLVLSSSRYLQDFTTITRCKENGTYRLFWQGEAMPKCSFLAIISNFDCYLDHRLSPSISSIPLPLLRLAGTSSNVWYSRPTRISWM